MRLAFTAPHNPAMGATTLTTLPAQIQAGDSLKVRLSWSDFAPSDGWSATMYLAGASAASKDATTDGDGFLFSWTADETATLLEGNYQISVKVKSGADAYTVQSDKTQVLPDPSQAAPGEMQAFAEKNLSVVEAALAGRLSSDMESYTIAGRMVSKIPISDLYKIRNQLRSEIAQARANGTGFGQTVEVHFGDATGIDGASPFGAGRFPWG